MSFFFILDTCVIAYRYNYQGINLWDCIYNYIDPVAGIMTFFTTLVIFYIQAKKTWEENLEKHLSIDYIYVDEYSNEAIICQIVDAYLSDEADIRAWSQSLGSQIMGNLDFDMNWDADKPLIKKENGTYFKKYKISIYLTRNPFETKNVSEAKENIPNDMGVAFCRFEKPKFENPTTKFLAKKFKHSEVIYQEHLPYITWKRKNI